MNESQKYFDPETLARIGPLGLRARALVEGLVAGLHRSPLRGHSIEFAQHREYTPGDDVRQIDWKVFARSDKVYVKQYEDETNLLCYLLLDTSQSMTFRGPVSPLSKLEYAQLIVACLTYLVITQQDSVAVGAFSAQLDAWLPPSSSPSQFDDMVHVLENSPSNPRTHLGEVIHQFTARVARPGIVIIVSDLLDDVQRLTSAWKLLRFQRHDVIVMQVLDAAELDFPFDRTTRFVGLEGLPEVVADARLVAAAYRTAMAQHCSGLQATCRELDIDYVQLRTNQSLAKVLPPILARRRRRRA